MSVGVDDLGRFLDRTNPARVPQFHAGRDCMPVTLSAWAPPVGQVMAVVDRAATAGFCYIDAGRPATEQDLQALADRLALDDPVAPPHRESTGPSVPTQRDGRSPADEAPLARSRAVQSLPAWRADTLKEAGDACTSMLLCVQSAGTDPPLQLFNVTAAFVDVARRDPVAAAALMPPAGPIHARSPRTGDPSVRHPFAVVNGHLLAGSPDDADRWARACAEPQAAERGLALLSRLATPGSPYHIGLPVAAGQGVVLSGARVWYAEAATTERMMVRGLFRGDLVLAGR